MRYPNSRNDQTPFVSSIDLRAPELHDFGDLPAIRPTRILTVVMVLAAVLTAGHFMHQSRMATMEADALQQTVGSHG